MSREVCAGEPFDAVAMLAEPRVRSSADRFWARVARGSACWEWQGQRSRQGYGKLRWCRAWVAAHRVAYSLANGPIEAGLLVRHTCDNPPCCNPGHLELGTDADNNRDMRTRGRAASRIGSNNGRARLSDALVMDLRRAWAAGATVRGLAQKWGVAPTTMIEAVHGHTWTHLPMPGVGAREVNP